MVALKENTSARSCDVLSDHDSPGKARVREAILRHLHSHPGAADTVKGIVGWWLPRTGYEYAPDHIAAVLEEMIAAGLLEAIKMPGGELVYRRGAVI